MKKLFFLLALISCVAVHAQKLESMQWFNEPDQWVVNNKVLTMQVTPKSDYWRVTHGFTIGDAPFLYTERGGSFEAKVKITGNYTTQYDQACLMLYIDKENYVKAGIEYVDGTPKLSVVVTHGPSDWSVMAPNRAVPYIWIRAMHVQNAVMVFYSFDDKEYVLMRDCYMPEETPIKVGLMGACPQGDGFEAKFENFSIKHIPSPRN